MIKRKICQDEFYPDANSMQVLIDWSACSLDHGKTTVLSFNSKGEDEQAMEKNRGMNI